MDRVQRKNGCRQIGSGNFQPAKDQRRQDGCSDMQHDVDDMVAERRITPEVPLDPKGRVQQGVVLLSCIELEPDSAKPLPRPQFGAGHVRVVVPQKLAAQRRPISHQRGCQQRRDQQPLAIPCPRNPSARLPASELSACRPSPTTVGSGRLGFGAVAEVRRFRRFIHWLLSPTKAVQMTGYGKVAFRSAKGVLALRRCFYKCYGAELFQ